MNKVILVGRLVRDPELRTTQAGTSVCNFTVACDRRYQKEGEERQADFINCIAWRQQADFISKFFSKGTRIALEGSIQTRSWDDDEGNRRYATEVIVDHVEFAQSKGEGQSNAASTNYIPDNSSFPDGFMPIPEDDDLPF